MPNNYTPDGLVESTKEKTPEEKTKEAKDALMAYYMKALEESKEKEDSVSSNAVKEINKKESMS
ncbi:hypothetical protein [Helicobacter sp.]|uniref:hypothetical protein n=1 Tax=Helicobacter sp. TaxID=218 RepID=UPI0025C3FC16|nr:hypothetical protein [Helicobacter sp.]MCI5969247.1 hypothetical protein [Helicobacter sp.]MDY2585502.1 hypothetical protein [Helicobacter sp.]